jgi:hypothetical protein
MIFDSDERAVLAGLADILIPAGEGFLSASEAGVASDGLDRVLSFRPELAVDLKRILKSAEGQPAVEFVAGLRVKDPAGFGILAELVPGAYFLNAQVRAKLGYHGQDPRPINPRPDYLDDGLLQSVVDRGPIYRPTPEHK